MTDRYALVDEDGLTLNVVLWDGQGSWTPPGGLTAVEAPIEAGIGWRLQDGQWLPPEEAA